MTIRHVVLMRLKADADVAAIKEALLGLRRSVDGILDISFGKDCSPEGLQRGNVYGFTVDFRDAKARDDYLPHPEHQKVGAMIVAATVGGVNGITVVDWEM